jgi:hypothetical protein
MFSRLVRSPRQSRAARSVEYFGWIDLVLGLVIFFDPSLTASVLHVPAGEDGLHLLRLVGLLVSGISTLYVVSGRLDSREFAFASLLDRPIVPVVMALLYAEHLLPGRMALAFSVIDFSGFLWTLASWQRDVRNGSGQLSSSGRIL